MKLDTLLESFHRAPEAAKTLVVLVDTGTGNKMDVIPLTLFNFQGGICGHCQYIRDLENLDVVKAYDAVTGQVYYPAATH